jgi:nicotinate-nucleotide adenylyltransferase
MLKRRIALFGGTFDPIHSGHTSVAATAVEVTGAEKVLFVPAKRSPLKKCFPIASDEDRFNMIALAIKNELKFEASDYELCKSGPSYTLETVKHFQEEFGGEVSICWFIGADGIEDLAKWWHIEELLDRCELCTMYRAGCEEPSFEKFRDLWGAERIAKLQQNVVATPLIDISSTEIRRRLCEGEDVSGMLTPAVEKYIRENDLYGQAEAS